MPHRKLIARLQAVVGVSARDQAKLASLPHAIKTLRDGDYVLRQGDAPFLARQRVVSERNHISSFYVPGDVPDLHTLHLPVVDHDLCSVGMSTIALIPHSHLKDLLASSQGLTNAFWRETLIHAAIYREWVENVGSRLSLPRVAHLLCELATRLEIVGLLDEGSFHLPFTQQDIADACGLSIVHVNRTIQELRKRGLIEWQGGVVHVLRREELEAIADFTSSYLHALGASSSGASQPGS